MPIWSDMVKSRSRRPGRREAPYRRSFTRNQPPVNYAIRRWFFCALAMLAVTALNFLPFHWATSGRTYLAYCFQPGAAAATEWAAWADWQADSSLITTVWQRITGAETVAGFAYPCTGQITSSYAWRHHPVTGQVEMHYGIDISGTEGTIVQAASRGVVREVAEQQALGNYVVVDHGEGMATRYAHLAEVLVEPGAEVTRGQAIGKMGSTGVTDDTHLHFEVIVDGQPVDPLSILPR